MKAKSILMREEVPANSRQTKTPHAAETIVAPCPMEYETAGPTKCVREATKLKIAPVHQITPPRMPQRCQIFGAPRKPEKSTAACPSMGFRISR